MEIDELTDIVINRAIKIHQDIGPGCFESVYEEILNYELIKAGLDVKRQLILPLKYDTLYFDKGYRLDLLVENQLIIELKVKNPLPAVAFDQLRTHLVLSELRHGLLLNFKESLMKHGIHRVFNNKGRPHL